MYLIVPNGGMDEENGYSCQHDLFIF